ncbi:MAG TPA: hypothetical protein VGM98_19345, partial [Schlesneria sp.]
MTIPRSIRTAFVTLVLFASNGLLLDCCNRLSAAPPGVDSKIVRINVPADRPDVWFRETKNLVAVQRDEFEQLLRSSEVEHPGPRLALVKSARYSATLAGNSLRDGRGQLSVQRVGSKSTLLPLGPMNVAIRDLGWSERPAIWGADEIGRSWLLADVPRGDIQMAWTAAGRNIAGDLNFDLQFPTSAMSSLDLRVPKNLSLRSSPEARRVEEGSDANWQVWKIQLGGEPHCRITASTAKPAVDRPPAILFEQELGAIVREQDLRFQTVFQVEVFDAPVTELTFNVPASVDVYAVTYGQDVP